MTITAKPSLKPSRADGGGVRLRPESWIQSLTWLVIVVGVLVPIVPLLFASVRDRPIYLAGGLFTLTPYAELFSDPEFWASVRNSLEFSVSATAGAVVLGAAAAIICVRTNVFGRRAFSALMLIPILLPPLGVILGWNLLYGPGGFAFPFMTQILHVPLNLTSVPGMSVLGAVVAVPLVFLTCQAALANIDSSLEDAARSSGARTWRVLTRIILPMLRPALLNSALLIFMLCMESLGIALVLGSPAGNNFIASYLYHSWADATTIDPAAVSAGAMILLLFAVVLLLLRRVLLGPETRFVAVTGRGRSNPKLIELGVIWRCVLCALLGIYVAVTIGLPLVALSIRSCVSMLSPLIPFWQTWSSSNWQQLTQPAFTSSVVNSIVIAVVGALATTAVVAIATVVAHRSRFRFRGSLQFVMLFPRSMPGIIVGIGFFWTYVLINPPGEALLNSIWGIMLALSVRSLTLAYLVIYPSLAAISSSLDDAARSSGSSWWRTTIHIVLPNLRPALFVAFVLLFVSILNDYDPALFLVSPGNEIMGVTMLESLAQGTSGPASAIAVVQVVISLVVISVAAIAFRKRRSLA